MSYSYQDFWKLRGTSAFWLTTHFGYRPGAVVACLAARVGLSPNMVSLLSLAAACVALVPVLAADWGRVAEGAWLGGWLLLSFWLDCADGVLARGTGKGSSFGAVLDKTIDMAVAVLYGSVLGVAALGSQAWWIPQKWQVLILPLSLVPKAALTVLNWLKDAQLHQTNRLRAYEPPSTLFGKAKRVVGNLFDDITLRCGAGVAWAAGCYWEFALAAGSVALVLLIGYLLTSKRDFDAFDRQKASIH